MATEFDPAHAFGRDTDKVSADQTKSGEEFAQLFSTFCNVMNNGPKTVAIDKMIRDHRTIQQNMMRFCLAFIARMAEQRSDLRNEASVELAKQIMDRTDYQARALPKI